MPLLHALSYAQSAINTRHITTIKAKSCRAYGIWGLKMASEAISQVTKFPEETTNVQVLPSIIREVLGKSRKHSILG